MKKYILSLFAIVIAIGMVAFTNHTSNNNNLTNHYFRYSGTNPLDISSYTELQDDPGGSTAAQKYSALQCQGSTAMCGIITTTTNPTLENDPNENGFPKVNSTVSSSDKKQ